MRRLFTIRQLAALVIVVVAVGFFAMAPTGAAGPPAQARASVSADSRACAVTGTFQWKNASSVDSVTVGIWSNSLGFVGEWSQDSPGLSGEISVTALAEPGQEYFVHGYTYGSPNLEDSTHGVTLRCR